MGVCRLLVSLYYRWWTHRGELRGDVGVQSDMWLVRPCLKAASQEPDTEKNNVCLR